MWCEEFKIKNNLAEISQNFTFPHFPFFEIFAHICLHVTCIPTISLLDLISSIYIFHKDCLPSHDNWKDKRGQDQNHLSFLLRKASYLLADKLGDQLHSCSCLVEKMSSTLPLRPVFFFL